MVNNEWDFIYPSFKWRDRAILGEKKKIFIKSVVSSFSIHQNHLEGLLNYWLLGSTPRVSDLGAPGWGPRVWISNKLLGDASFADLGTTIWEPLFLNELNCLWVSNWIRCGHLQHSVWFHTVCVRSTSHRPAFILVVVKSLSCVWILRLHGL